MKRLLLLFALLAVLALSQCYKHQLQREEPELATLHLKQLEREAESLRISMICKMQQAEQVQKAYSPDAAQMKSKPVLKQPPIYRVSATDAVHGYDVPE